MAFSNKLITTLKDACEVARADDARLFAFVLKNKGQDAQTFAANTSKEVMFCVMATVITGLEEVCGIDRKKIFKILEKSMKEAPIERKEVKDE